MGKLRQDKLDAMSRQVGRFSDGDGLFFRSLGLGRAYWVYRYAADGRTREMSLGPYPELSMTAARLKHVDLRRRVKIDKADPLAEREAAKAAAGAPKNDKRTFGECADRFLDRKEERGELGRNPSHRAQWRSTLAGLPPWFRALPVDEIGPRHVFDALDPIWTKTPETASRLRGRIAAVIDDAREPEDMRANPAAWSGWLKTKLGSPRKLGKIDRKTGARVDRSSHAAMPLNDIPAFMTRLQATPGVAAKALIFAILTGARSNEVFGMEFGEIRLDHEELVAGNRRAAIPMWMVPAERMKMRLAHRVPLSPQVVDILVGQLDKRGKKQILVFESPIGVSKKIHRDGGHQPLSAMALTMTMRRLGAGGYTVHGFRSALHKWATEIAAADLATVEKCLAHQIGTKVTQAYDRSDRFVLRQPLMRAWAEYCLPAEAEPKVVDFDARRKRR